ncbi:dual specificity phosphatase [Pilobolus umbonatus]|nr:dual specificity phosphatase [Pilobolus umbonatus]
MPIVSMKDPLDPHLHEIVSRIFLGDCESFTKETLIKHKISHVLSVGNFSNDLDLPIEYKNIYINDTEDSNIIQYFDESNKFIQEANKAGGRILIHCQAGVSRSATLLASCIMKSKNVDRDTALNIIKKKRSCIAPNEGFMNQLQLYFDLCFDVDSKHTEYRRFLVATMAEEQRNYGYVEHSSYAPDPEHHPLSNTDANKPFKALRCRKCRRLLVGGDNVIDHQSGKGQVAFSYHKRNTDINITTNTSAEVSEASASLNTVNTALNPLLAALASKNNVCSSYFIEPMEWFNGQVDDIQGRIDCPKCQCKLGSYNWAGDQCSCGRWITPTFMLHRNKVDEIKNVTPRK